MGGQFEKAPSWLSPEDQQPRLGRSQPNLPSLSPSSWSSDIRTSPACVKSVTRQHCDTVTGQAGTGRAVSKTTAVLHKPWCKEKLWVELSCARCMPTAPPGACLTPPQFVICVPGPMRCPSAHPALIKCSSRSNHSASGSSTSGSFPPAGSHLASAPSLFAARAA